MEEKQLLKLALTVSFAGLLILIFISNSIEVNTYKISEINEKLLEKNVRINGIITRLTETPGLFIFDITDNTGTITAIAFKESFNLTKNQEILLAGKVKKYKNKLEISVEQIQ